MRLVSTLNSPPLSSVEYATLDGADFVFDVLTSWPTAIPAVSVLSSYLCTTGRCTLSPVGTKASLLRGTKRTCAANR